MITAIDTDILIKGACFLLLPELVAAAVEDGNQPAALGAAKYMLERAIEKKLAPDAATAEKRQGLEILGVLATLEPSPEEARHAAELERVAIQENVDLDSGESIAVAMLLAGSVTQFATGDKRALTAIHTLRGAGPELAGKFTCLEQLFLRVLARCGLEYVRPKVCAKTKVDVALRASFSCSSTRVELENVLEGLNSYIASARRVAGHLLSDN